MERPSRKSALQRLGRAVYCPARLADDPWTVIAAWLRVLPAETVCAGRTAAWLHGLETDGIHPVEVIVPAASWARSRAGLRVRRCTLDADEIVCLRDRRVTSVERTLRDVALQLAEVDVLAAIDAALHRGLIELSALGQHPRLSRLAKVAAPAESPMETRLRWLLMQAGLPLPEVQANLHDARGRFVGRADLFYRPERLVIEYDGSNHRERLVDDDRRQNALVSAGYTLLRYTASDVYHRPEAITAQVRQALASGTTPPAAAGSA